MTFLSQFIPYSLPNLGLIRLPEIIIDPKDKSALGLRATATNTDYLKKVCWVGYLAKKARGKFKNISEGDVKDRLRMEFSVFTVTGMLDYMLLVWDYLNWCDKQDIPRGPGRGSSASSLALYCLNVTDVNPLHHPNLTFTRFLSEARAKPKIVDGILMADGKSMCDIDSDISFVDRDKLIRYIEEKYAGKTCKISTRLQLTGKTALKDTLKVLLEFDEGQAKAISDFVEARFGKTNDLSKALKENKDFQQWLQESPSHQKAYLVARGIESLNHAKGMHPSGVFISYHPLDGNVPVELSKDKSIVTSNDMNVAATISIKADLLGLRAVDTIHTICQLVEIKAADIDVNDQSIYDYLQKGKYLLGLFQIEQGLTRDVIEKTKPRHIDDLAACLAISRPSSLKYIDEFVKYVHTGEFNKVYPPIDKILETTGGVLLYQEQLSRICQEVYGLTAVQADEVRRATGKKDRDEMKKWEPFVQEGGKARNVPEEVTKWFWAICDAAADYSFCAAHAYAYSYITATMTYLKAHYPKEFVLAQLKMSRYEPDSQVVLNSIIAESKLLGIKILPPDISKSTEDFVIEGDGVRFGLSHIRGVSDTTMAKLVSFKREFKSKFDIFDAAQMAKINISVLTGLILCGCIDSGSQSRTKLAIEAQAYNLLTDREKRLVQAFGADYGFDLMEIIKVLKTKTDEKGKPYLKESRLDTFRRDLTPYWKMYQQNSRHEELAVYLLEKHYLGFSYSNTLHNLYSAKVSDLVPVDIASKEPKDVQVSFVAFVDEIKRSVGKESKKPYMRIGASDESGSITVLISGQNKIDACIQFNGDIAEGDVIVVHGRSSGDGTVFVGERDRQSSMIKQSIPIRLKKS